MDDNGHGGDEILWIVLLVVLFGAVFLFLQDLFDALGILERPDYLRWR